MVDHLGPLFGVSSEGPFLSMKGDSKAVGQAVWGWQESGLTVRRVRGRKMTTAQGLFDEMAAALQFPAYFGENWNAFDECISDMDWLPLVGGLAILVSEPHKVLAEAPGELSVLVRALQGAHGTYSQPIAAGEPWDRPAVPFHMVLVGADETQWSRWRGAGAWVRALDF